MNLLSLQEGELRKRKKKNQHQLVLEETLPRLLMSSHHRGDGGDVISSLFINVEKKHHIFSLPCDGNGRFKTEAETPPEGGSVHH